LEYIRRALVVGGLENEEEIRGRDGFTPLLGLCWVVGGTAWKHNGSEAVVVLL
jgi:hypothetical protein